MRTFIQLASASWFAMCSLTFSACMTLPGARPLERGAHQVGVTVGGPAVEFNDAPVPLPNAIIEGRSGLGEIAERPVDLNYGVNATAIAFGIAQLHLGSSYLLLEERDAIPALSLTNRLFFATNALAPMEKRPGTKRAWGAHQLELAASYLLGGQLVYVGLGQYTDFGAPDVLLTPSLGAQFDFGERGEGVNLLVEARYYGVNKRKELTTVEWTSGPRGALGVGVGVGYTFGKKECGCSVDQ